MLIYFTGMRKFRNPSSATSPTEDVAGNNNDTPPIAVLIYFTGMRKLRNASPATSPTEDVAGNETDS